MLMVCFAAFFGAFEQGRQFQDGKWRTGLWEHHPPQLESLGRQLGDFAEMWWEWTTPWLPLLVLSEYDPHTWTIPMEFRSSIVLFVVLLASTGLKSRWQFGLFLIVTLYSLVCTRWEVASFTGGAIVARLHLAASEKQRLLPIRTASSPTSIRLWKWPLGVLNILGLTISLFILSFPDEQAGKTPGYRFLNRMTLSTYQKDPREFWNPLAAIMILWFVEQVVFVRRFLSSEVPQYLGKISYGFYLVHGPLLHSVGFALQPRIWEVVGGDTAFRWCGGLFLGWILMLTLSIAVGHLFWLFVDAPLVRATRAFERLARRRCT